MMLHAITIIVKQKQGTLVAQPPDLASQQKVPTHRRYPQTKRG